MIAVIYGGEPGTIVQSGAMEFTIILDDPGNASYETLTITDEVIAEAEMILTSFTVGSSKGGPFPELSTYVNDEVGFALNYPVGWSLSEVNDEDFVGPGTPSVQLSQGTVKLIIGYRRLGENVAISGSGAPGGEFDVRGTVQVAGQDVNRHVIVYEGKDKAVMYGQPGTLISAGGLEFALRLDDFDPDFDNVELSQSVQEEADLHAGTDFRQDLIAGYRTYLNSLGVDSEGVIEDVAIAGESAVRLRHPGTSEADPPRDDFFFMHGNTLFSITITHFGGVEDAVLNDQFLQSITLDIAYPWPAGELDVGVVEKSQSELVRQPPAYSLRATSE